MLQLAALAASTATNQLLLVCCAIFGTVGLITFFYGWSRHGKSEMSGVVAFAGAAVTVVAVLVAAAHSGT